jgi:hypothetical protein
MAEPRIECDAALAAWAEGEGVAVHVRRRSVLATIIDEDSAAEALFEFSPDGTLSLAAMDTVLSDTEPSARLLGVGTWLAGCNKDPATVEGVPEAPVIPPGPVGERLQYAALHYVNKLSSAHAPCTEGGNLACAWAVNYIVRVVTGSALGSTEEMLSTRNMYERLRSAVAREIPWADAAPGDIVISPTGMKVGHVGIFVSNADICSNSSAHARWEQNYTKDSWKARYAVKRGLLVKVFRLS